MRCNATVERQRQVETSEIKTQTKLKIERVCVRDAERERERGREGEREGGGADKQLVRERQTDRQRHIILTYTSHPPTLTPPSIPKGSDAPLLHIQTQTAKQTKQHTTQHNKANIILLARGSLTRAALFSSPLHTVTRRRPGSPWEPVGAPAAFPLK